MMLISKPKKKTLQTLIKEADTAFSIYIRLRDCDDKGTITCVTCGERLWWRDADCCHLISRSNMNTRYEEMNAAGGCRECNRMDSVEHLNILEEKLIDKHGIDLITQMQIFGKGLRKFMPFELEELIEGLKLSTKQLGKNHLL